MKKLYLLLASIFTLTYFGSTGQNVAINSTGAKPDSSGMLDIQSSDKGLLIPRMTESQRIAIPRPATGLLVYQINSPVGFYYNAGSPAVPNWFLLAKENSLPVVATMSDTAIRLNNTNDSIKLTGSAIDNDGSVRGYLWSEVAGPNTPLLSTPGSSSTNVKGLVNGTYLFQLMATDNKGATALKSVSVAVTIGQISSITLQPTQNPNEVYLGYAHYGDISNPITPELGAIAWTADGDPAILRGLFKFDLSSIPQGATILSAKLSLYSNPTPYNGDLIHANAGSSNSMLLQRVVSNWTNAATWFNQPVTDDSSQIVIPHTDQSFLDLTNVDVTNMVKAMLPNANYGFLIKLENEAVYNSRLFCSSRYSDATKHPRLEVQYVK